MSFLSPSLRLENLSTKPIMSLDHLPEEKRYNKNNIVAKWCAPINGKMYRIELEHGTTSGRRMIWVNGKVTAVLITVADAVVETRRMWEKTFVIPECIAVDPLFRTSKFVCNL